MPTADNKRRKSLSRNPVRAVVRVRTLGPSGLNPPQIGAIDRLQTLADRGPIDEVQLSRQDSGSLDVVRTGLLNI
ncbi:HTH domain-containing protein [Halalkalicoccus paucihalophilus]|uniref:HTH domain-containing protein n=1 Tax=Halalkalicoccus paucihalophilus TaxID=1008153 RepID=UPI0034A0EB8E